jgi:hypothetical protein
MDKGYLPVANWRASALVRHVNKAAALLLPFLLLPVMAAAAPPRTVGQLLNVNGSVEVHRSNGPAQKGTLLFQLQAGDVLNVRNGGQAELVLFENGHRFLLDGPSAARVEAGGLKPASGAAPRALKSLSPVLTRQINRPARTISPRFLGVLVRDPGDPTVGPRNPQPNGAVRGAPVVLRWAGPVEGESLHLQISDGERIVHTSELLPTTREYQVPAGVLQPGQYYVWSVTAMTNSVSSARCRALLRLLTPAEQAALDRLEQDVRTARAAAPANPADLLLLAQAYEQLGIFEAARASIRRRCDCGRMIRACRRR